MSNKPLKIIGAKEHNLKNLSLEIQHDQLTVITGLSGAGKSSLAFDTLHAEGQQRYVETFSTYTRQFLDKVKKPDLDLIENVRPSIAIEQRTRILNSRSTVGSLTDLNDYLALLWSQLSAPACPDCGIDLKQPSAQELSNKICQIVEAKTSATIILAAKLSVNPKKYKSELARLQQFGYARLVDPSTATITKIDDHIGKATNEVIVALERFRSGAAVAKSRLLQTINQAYSLGSELLDLILIEQQTTPNSNSSQRPWLKILQDQTNQKIENPNIRIKSFLASPACGRVLQSAAKPKSSIFSWNNPIGACSTCKGFGRVIEVDPELVVPNQSLSLKADAIACWAGPASTALKRRLLKFCEDESISITEPWYKLPTDQQNLIFDAKKRNYYGLRPWFKKLERKAYKVSVRTFLARYRSQFDCPTCLTKRLKPEGLGFLIEGVSIASFLDLSADQAITQLNQWQNKLGLLSQLNRSNKELFNTLLTRLEFMSRLGLGYLTLNRQARTLSGGETQRVSLAAALGSELVSTQFVLDEPTVGLHPKDTRALVQAIRSLQQKGNTVIVVEHDPDFIMQADQIIELGPVAGSLGGEIVYSGAIKNWPHKQIQSQYELSKTDPTKLQHGLAIEVELVRNIKNLSTQIPRNLITCLTGVSGSGKSTLIEEVILKSYDLHRQKNPNLPNNFKVTGFDQFSTVLLVDQQPIGKTPRANIATYCGFWERIRILLSKTELAQQLGLTKSHFSFNVDGGRCPHCKGAGFIRESMQFLSDAFLPCDACLGQRFLPITLRATYKQKTVSELLHLTISDCLDFFDQEPLILESCKILQELGLGHLEIGHALSELSGGEAQRLKLIPFLQKTGASTKALLILDEPTTGLHVRDTQKLISLLRELQKRGHTILCIEHNPLVILSSDWIIDLGPGAGPNGGKIVAEGSPASLLELAKTTPERSATAEHLLEFDQTWRTGKALKKASKSLPAPVATSETSLIIEGAREHNLKNIDIKIPYNKTIAITGLSGSGKSTLARDIIHAEGQRRYLDCLSPYARQFITELQKPQVDSIKNVAPTICVQQHLSGLSRVSTIATLSEIYSYLRLLVSKVGQLHCPEHPEAVISSASPKQLAETLKSSFSQPIRILAPLIKAKKGNHSAILERALQSELSEIRVDGVLYKSKQIRDLSLERNKIHNIDFVLGRFNPSQMDLELISECLQEALLLGSGSLIVLSDRDQVYSQERACPICQRGFLKPDPEDLSFSSRRGRCHSCDGTGLDAKGKTCKTCHGQRLSEIGRNIRLLSKNISELCNQRPSQLLLDLNKLSLTAGQNILAGPILNELRNKLGTLISLGLDLLTLDRDCKTLSGGELQRLRLAAALGTPLNSVLYILDEPSANLHPLDHAKVLKQIEQLKAYGNSVILIEHDLDSINHAEYIIEVGPGAGSQGGTISFEGNNSDFIKKSKTTTAEIMREYLSTGRILSTESPQNLNRKNFLKIESEGLNNIGKIDLKLPLNHLVVVAGVSGSGKSSLTNGILLQTCLDSPGTGSNWKLGSHRISSTIPIDRVLAVDQKPIGANSRSTPASYLGILDHLRKVYASTLEAKTRGYTHSFFSYNSGKGRCKHCKGLGEIKLEMSFLPDAHVLCPACAGQRYLDETLEIKYLNHNFSELLNLTISEASELFLNHRIIGSVLRSSIDLGLGYLKLGQSSATLSGGESQRLKLAIELASRKQTHNLYILDEPSIGLHPKDLERLIRVLRMLVQQGHSVIVIEHDLQMLQSADWIIEMGPGSASDGGKVVFEGDYLNLSQSNSAWGKELQTINSRISASDWRKASN
jgi:excinuclease ABC subunit A